MNIEPFTHVNLRKMKNMEVLSKTVRNALKTVINKCEIRDYKITTSSASNKGDGFAGELYRLKVNGERNDQPVELNLVCKVPPSNWNPGEDRVELTSYQREVFVYNVILEHFKRFQFSKGIPPNQLFTSYAKCYSADATPNTEYLIMEDLKAKSFELFDLNKKLDRPHVQLFVENLAKFHAVSFACKDQQPEEYKKYTLLPEVMIGILGKTKWNNLCEFGLNQALKNLQDPDHKKKLKKVKESCEEILEHCFHGIGSEDYRIMTHGDCWSNNVMFRYQDKIPTEICFFDWQLSRYTSPVIDLCNYFYLSTEKEILDEHFDDLTDLYHAHLSKSIRLLGSNPEQLYPYEVFQSDLKKFAKFGVIISSFALNFHIPRTEEVLDVGDMTNITEGEEFLETHIGFKDDYRRSIYQRRMRDVIRHACERNYL